MKTITPLLSLLLCLAPLAALPENTPTPVAWRFEVTIRKDLTAPPTDGRLFVILARTNSPEPCLMLGRTGLDAPEVLARDVRGFAPGAVTVLDASVFTFPIPNLADVPAGDYFVQALLDSNIDLRLTTAPGNLYSKPQKIHLNPAHGGDWKL